MFNLFNLFRPSPYPTPVTLRTLERTIMTTQQELAQGLASLAKQVAKIGEETAATLQKVSELQDAIDNSEQGVSDEVQAAFESLKSQILKVDDLVPDATSLPNPSPADTGEPSAPAVDDSAGGSSVRTKDDTL